MFKKLLLKRRLIKDIDNFKDFSGYIYISENNKVIFNKGFGFSSYEKGLKNKIDTKFRIGSLTKQFTSLSIMLLEEQGCLSVTDTISKYIKDYPNGNKITLHQLLSMSTGIPNYLNDLLFKHYDINTGKYICNSEKDFYFSSTELINLFKNKPLKFTPGTQYEYSNSNYIILGHIIELISKISYGEFIKEYIFEPLNMSNSGYDYDSLEFNKSIGYENTDTKNVTSFSFNNSIMFSAGGLYSTIADLVKWDKSFYGNKLVKKDTISKIFNPYTNMSGSNYYYSYGWIVDKTAKKCIAEHVGAVPGFISYMNHNQDLNRSLIILSNNDSYLRKFSDLYSGILELL